jgi:hypothetical protein
MPTQVYEVTAAPVNLIGATGVDGAALSLEVGKTYSGRFVAIGVQSILKMVEAPDGTTVAASDPALPVRIFEDVTIVPKTGMAIFAWSEDQESQLIINAVA